MDTYAKLLAHAESFGSFDGGDQGLFNAYFSDWSTADINRILPFGYNVHAAATYTYAPAYKVNARFMLHLTKDDSSSTMPTKSASSTFLVQPSHGHRAMRQLPHHLVTSGLCGGSFTRSSTRPKVSKNRNIQCNIDLDCFAPVFTPSNCAEQAVAQQHQQQPEWLHQDTVEAAERRWLENVPDYMNKDNFDKIQAHIDNEINKDTFY